MKKSYADATRFSRDPHFDNNNFYNNHINSNTNGQTSYPNFDNRNIDSYQNRSQRFNQSRSSGLVNTLSAPELDTLTKALSAIQNSVADLTKQVHSLSSRISSIESQINSNAKKDQSFIQPNSANNKNKEKTKEKSSTPKRTYSDVDSSSDEDDKALRNTQQQIQLENQQNSQQISII